jgi:hypothetical protein
MPLMIAGSDGARKCGCVLACKIGLAMELYKNI